MIKLVYLETHKNINLYKVEQTPTFNINKIKLFVYIFMINLNNLSNYNSQFPFMIIHFFSHLSTVCLFNRKNIILMRIIDDLNPICVG